ncbi:MAG: FAD-dependent oxidoreductase, partial [Aestuariivirga sp.]
MADTFDIIVIGAGIAGASVAAHLAETKRVLILEMEDRPGFHTTGRSAATFEPTETLLASGSGLEELSEAQALKHFPILRKGYAKRTFLDPHTGDLDVDLLHRGYLKLFKARGGRLLNSAAAETILRPGHVWEVITPQGIFETEILVNAAGAWGDAVAARAGVKPVGLQPKRRSIGVIPVDGIRGVASFPMV